MTQNAETPRLDPGALQEVSAAGGRTAVTVPQQLRRRREAARRCPPLRCGHQDPLDCLASPNSPSTYGLTDRELRQHANDLIRAGWSLDEILTRLDVQPRAGLRQPWLTSDRMGVAA